MTSLQVRQAFAALRARSILLERRIEQLERRVNSAHAVRVEFYTIIGGEKRKVESMFLKVNQMLPLSVAFKDAQGNDAKVDGLPQWSVVDASLAELKIAGDGMSATVLPLGLVGETKVQVKVDADLGEGVREILGELELSLISSEAEVIVITPGEPIPKA